jgi:hypothetical protein
LIKNRQHIQFEFVFTTVKMLLYLLYMKESVFKKRENITPEKSTPENTRIEPENLSNAKELLTIFEQGGTNSEALFELPLGKSFFLKKLGVNYKGDSSFNSKLGIAYSSESEYIETKKLKEFRERSEVFGLISRISKEVSKSKEEFAEVINAKKLLTIFKQGGTNSEALFELPLSNSLFLKKLGVNYKGDSSFNSKLGIEYSSESEYIETKKLKELRERSEITRLILDLVSLSKEVPLSIYTSLKSALINQNEKLLFGESLIFQKKLDSLAGNDLKKRIVAVAQRCQAAIVKINAVSKVQSISDNNKDTFQSELAIASAIDTQFSQLREVQLQITEQAFKNRRKLYLSVFPEIRSVDKKFEIISIFEKSSSDEDNKVGAFLRKITYLEVFSQIKNEVFDNIRKGSIDSLGKAANLLDSFPNYPNFSLFAFFDESQAFIKKCKIFITESYKLALALEGQEIRENFAEASRREEIFNRIAQIFNGLPKKLATLDNNVIPNIAEAFAKNLLSDYQISLGISDSEYFEDNILPLLREESLQASATNGIYEKPNLGTNKEAFRTAAQNFTDNILPLFLTLIQNPDARVEIEKYIKKNDAGEDPKDNFNLNTATLSEQRELTEIEKEYIQSVELLSKMNPHLVSLLSTEFELVASYLRQHFADKSLEMQEQLTTNNEYYVSLVQIGMGPNGVNAAGELLRQNPELSANTLYIDQGEMPGGPFAVPRGEAWELNSANSGALGFGLPDTPAINETKTVRGYGSPIRFLPGERVKDSDIRSSSINTTVGWLPTTDNLSLKRYPTNYELAVLVQMQTALVTNKISLNTKVTSVEKNDQGRGQYLITAVVNSGHKDERTVKIRTDGVVVAAGLGEPKLGFNLETSRIKNQKDATNEKGQKVLINVLEFFRELADKESQEKQQVGKTLVIYGSGNSADTTLEYLGKIFGQADSPAIRGIEKIYLIAKGNLSARPRYAKILDLKARNGNSSLLEQVRLRVGDVGFSGANGKLVANLYDPNGDIIKDSNGAPIVADRVISTAGFESQLDTVFEPLISDNQTLELRNANSDNTARKPILLPGTQIPVADILVNNPNILFVGTASNPNFAETSPFSLEKLAQLPQKARDALLRNGVENAVAIGFRGPDVEAALNIFLNERDIDELPSTEVNKTLVNVEGDLSSLVINTVIPFNSIKKELQGKESLLLSSLLVKELVQRNIKYHTSEKLLNLDFTIGLEADNQLSIIMNAKDSSSNFSKEFGDLLTFFFKKPLIQSLVKTLSERKRGSNKNLDMNITFRGKRVLVKDTYIQ